MKSRLLPTGLALLLAGTWVLGGGPTEDQRRMAGSWSAITVEVAGRELALQERDRLQMRLVVDAAGNYSIFFSGQQAARGVIRLNPSTKPASIDVIPAEGPNKDKVQPGIYAFQGEDLWTVFAEPGQPRPTGFKTRPGSTESMIFHRRSSLKK